MRLKHLLFIGIFISLTVSCTPIMKTLYGIKDPRVENKETLAKYLDGIGLGHEVVYIPSDMSLMPEVNEEFGRSVPEAVLFDSEGNRRTYKDSDQDCNAGLFATIPGMNKNTVLKSEKGADFISFTRMLSSLEDQSAFKMHERADYHLFISWTKYTGKLNKDHVREWVNLASTNDAVNIAVYLVNMDFQESWGLELGKKM